MEPQYLKVLKPVVSKGKKGSKSKTIKGKLDFTTKKGSKEFNRGNKRQTTAQGSKIKRKPYE